MDDDLKSASDSLNQPDPKPAYHPGAGKKPQRHIPKWPFITLAILVVLAGGAYGVLKFVAHRSKKPVVITDPNTSVTQAPATKSDVPNAASSESYSSTALSVGFKYPKGWKVTEANGGIRIESPAFTYPAMELGDVDGLFRIYIRQGARAQDGKYIGNGYAVKPSEKLVYTQPANGQRADTLLSTFGAGDSSNFNFFFIAGNFQLNKDDTLGPDYGKEPDTYIIAGGYTTPTAADDLAMSSVALDYYATTNAYKQALQTIASLQLK